MTDKTDARTARVVRETNETQIQATLSPSGKGAVRLETGLPFFDHMLHALFFHGGFDLALTAKGDIEVEPHHLVEDVGIVLGKATAEIFDQNKAICRFGCETIPMDDALCRAVVDLCGRPYLVYRVAFPQPTCGTFDLSLLKEFFYAFAVNAGINLHAEAFYGENSHHIAEALFKALGKSLGAALTLSEKNRVLSTKGKIDR